MSMVDQQKLEALHQVVILADTRAEKGEFLGVGMVTTDILRDVFDWKYETSEVLYEVYYKRRKGKTDSR